MKRPSHYDTLDPSGSFQGQQFTGFCYYNFDRGMWEDIGLTDPATGESILFDYAAEIIDYGLPATVNGLSGSYPSLISSGTNNWPAQFSAPWNLTYGEDTGGEIAFVQNGLPTFSNFAPFKTTYHATSSQSLKMSNYIQHPMLLEKIVVEDNRRIHGIRIH